MENDLAIGVIMCFRRIRVSEICGTILRVLMMKMFVYPGLYWGPPILGDYLNPKTLTPKPYCSREGQLVLSIWTAKVYEALVLLTGLKILCMFYILLGVQLGVQEDRATRTCETPKPQTL